MTDAAALAVMNLTSKSVHSHDSSKEAVMIYYSLSCTRAATNALDVSQIFFSYFFLNFVGGRGDKLSFRGLCKEMNSVAFVCFTFYPVVLL